LRNTLNKMRVIGLNWDYFLYRTKWNLLGKYPFSTRVPIHVDIELSSYCNLKCTMCPHGDKNIELEQGFIDTVLAKKIIDECGRYGVASLKFSGRGEAMLHPDFVDLIKHAKAAGLLDIMFNTNGLNLTEEIARELVNSQIDLIIISIDGASKETYEKIRVGGDFETLVNNINYLVNYRKKIKARKPMIRLQFVKMQENMHEFEAYQKMWRDTVDVLVGLDYSNRVGDEDKSTLERTKIGRAYCPHPWRRLTVTSRGKALMCCVDWDSKYVVGDCSNATIKEIWHGKAIQHGRACIKKLQHENIPSCKDCFAPISYKWKDRKKV